MGAGRHQGGLAGRCRTRAGRGKREAGGPGDGRARELRHAVGAGQEAAWAASRARGQGTPPELRRLPGHAPALPRLSRERGGRAGGRGGGASGGGLAPERRGVGAIKMHPMQLPMEKDGTETQQQEEVVKAEEDAQEAAAAAAGK